MDHPPQNTQRDAAPAVKLDDRQFAMLSRLVYDRCGIKLGDQKRTLLETRLNKLMRGRAFAGVEQYCKHLVEDRTGRAVSDLVDAIATNHTYFFREREHFDYLARAALPDLERRLSAARNPDLRVWCAASSSGEEPYGLLITMMEYFGDRYQHWRAGLLATDISTKVLDLATEGVYRAEQVASVPKALLSKYFTELDADRYQVKPHLRREATFRRFNLMNAAYPFREPFHMIFCRNVMIYFDQPTIQAVVGRLSACLAPGGYLFIGHSESLSGAAHDLEKLPQAAAFRKPG